MNLRSEPYGPGTDDGTRGSGGGGGGAGSPAKSVMSEGNVCEAGSRRLIDV